MTVTRITLVGLLFVPLILLGKRDAELCGSYPERAIEELYRAKGNLERRQLEKALRKMAGGLGAAEEVRGATRDQGDIVLMEEDAAVVSRRNLFNLANKTLRFTPAGAGSYKLDVMDGDYNSAEADAGQTIGLGDDDSWVQAIGFGFHYFGTTQRNVYVNSDGNLTFGEGDSSTADRSLGRLLSGAPRIAGFFQDLDPSRAGTIKILSTSERLVVSWVGVPQYASFGTGPLNTFQVRLLANGTMEIAFQAIQTSAAVVGIAPGRLVGGTNVQPFLSASGQTYTGAIAERFTALEEIDIAAAAQRFYENHEDAYDYLAFYNVVGVTAGSGVVAYETTVRNNRRGYGDREVDFGKDYGSARRLQAVLNMGPVTQYPVDPNGILGVRASARDTPITVLAHEAGHLFLAFASVRDPQNPTSLPMLGRQSAHWNFTFNSEASLLEGNRILDKGPGAVPRFETVAVTQGYSPLDQYLMGLRAKEDVGPLFYVSGSTVSFLTSPQVGVTFNGTRRDVTVDELIGVVGPRIPDYTVSQKKYRFAIVVIVPKGFTHNEALITQVDNYRRGFENYYFRAADERAMAETTLKRSVRLSLWPASGVVQGRTTTASIELASSADTARTFTVKLRNGLVKAPGTVTVAAGQRRAEFTIAGDREGVEVVEVSGPDASYEVVEARVQVLSAPSGLSLEVVSGDKQVAGTDFLTQPVVVRVMDKNRLPYAGWRVVADAFPGGTVEPASAMTDENGQVSFRWRPAAAPLNRLRLTAEGGSFVEATALGRPFLLSETVVNGASFANGITPLGIHTVFGANLAGGVTQAASLPWPRQINGIEVRVNGVAQPLIYVSDGQVNFYVADALNGATSTTVQVVTALGQSAAVSVPVRRVLPGIFPGAVLRRGEFLEVYATGLGPVEPRGGLEWVTSPVEATVNGAPAEVTFAGYAPGFIGLYQVNLRVTGGATGDLRVRLKVAGVDSNEMVVP
jgi:uncharacterized protein (TIGR03437 family)